MTSIYPIIFAELCKPNYSMYKFAQEDVTYSSLMRTIKKEYSEDVLREFRQIYKDSFDSALLDEESDPESIALDAAIDFLNDYDDDLDKTSKVIEILKIADGKLGNPQDVGIYLADLIRFILRRIDPNSRAKTINNLKQKVLNLNEREIAAKKMPPGASIGQSLVIVKHLLFGKDPQYVREVLNNISQNL